MGAVESILASALQWSAYIFSLSPLLFNSDRVYQLFEGVRYAALQDGFLEMNCSKSPEYSYTVDNTESRFQYNVLSLSLSLSIQRTIVS
jgi:hypothetical protein